MRTSKPDSSRVILLTSAAKIRTAEADFDQWFKEEGRIDAVVVQWEYHEHRDRPKHLLLWSNEVQQVLDLVAGFNVRSLYFRRTAFASDTHYDFSRCTSLKEINFKQCWEEFNFLKATVARCPDLEWVNCSESESLVSDGNLVSTGYLRDFNDIVRHNYRLSYLTIHAIEEKKVPGWFQSFKWTGHELSARQMVVSECQRTATMSFRHQTTHVD